MTDDEQADAPTEQSQSESPVASLPMPRRFACGAHGRAENGSGAFHHGEPSPTTDPSLEARGDAGTSQSARRGPALRLTFSTGPEITVLPRVLEDLLVDLLAPLLLRRFEETVTAALPATVQRPVEADVNAYSESHIPEWPVTRAEEGCGCA